MSTSPNSPTRAAAFSRRVLPGLIALAVLGLVVFAWVWWTSYGRYYWAAREVTTVGAANLLKVNPEEVERLCADERGANTFVEILVSWEEPTHRLVGWDRFALGDGSWEYFRDRAIETARNDPDPEVRRRALSSLVSRLDPPRTLRERRGLDPSSIDYAVWKEETGRVRAEWTYEQFRLLLFTEPQLQATVLHDFYKVYHRTEDADYYGDIGQAIASAPMSKEAKLWLLDNFRDRHKGVALLIPLFHDPDPAIAEQAASRVLDAMYGLFLSSDQIASAEGDPAKKRDLVMQHLERFKEECRKRRWPVTLRRGSK